MSVSFQSLEQEASLVLARVADRFDYQASQLFKTQDLTPAQFNVLRILRGAGDAGHPCGEIASRLLKHVPDLTRVLDKLEARALVRRERETEDRRVVRVWITEAGRELLGRLDKSIVELHAGQFQGLTKLEIVDLVKLLEKLVN